MAHHSSPAVPLPLDLLPRFAEVRPLVLIHPTDLSDTSVDAVRWAEIRLDDFTPCGHFRFLSGHEADRWRRAHPLS